MSETGTKGMVPAIRFEGFDEAWDKRKIGSVLTETKRSVELEDDTFYQLVTVKRRNGGVIPRTKLKGRDILVKNYFELKSGDYLISKRQVVHGSNGSVPKELNGAVVSNEYLVVTDNKDISTKFWTVLTKRPEEHKRFFISSYGVDIEKLVFDVEDWKKRNITIPKLPEQNEITLFFQELDALIAGHRGKQDKLLQFKKSLLEKTFPKQDQDKPEIRFVGFERDWVSKPLGSMGETYSGLSGKTKKDFGHGTANFVSYVSVFKYPVGRNYLMEPIGVDGNQNEVKSGDIFFTTSSETPEEVGMSSVWIHDNENVYLNSFCFGYRPKQKMDNYFIAYLLRGSMFRKQITFLAQGISRYNISKVKAMNIPISFPKTDEQTKIGLLFKHTETLIDQHQTQITKLLNIKRAFLAKMFA